MYIQYICMYIEIYNLHFSIILYINIIFVYVYNVHIYIYLYGSVLLFYQDFVSDISHELFDRIIIRVLFLSKNLA